MSSAASSPATKKRRLRGACDTCRRQKIRCDSAKMPDKRCSNCISFGSECTHTMGKNQAGKARRVPEQSGDAAIEIPIDDSATETAKKVVEGILSETFHAPQDREALLQLLLNVSRYARTLEEELIASRHNSQSPSNSALRSSPPTSDDQDTQTEPGMVVDIQRLPEHLQRMTTKAANRRFFGKDSGFMFVKAALEARHGGAVKSSVPRVIRPDYWSVPPWETDSEPLPTALIFPPPDLLLHLVEIYFTQINIYTFILHRPTFEQGISDALHLHDHRFGEIVLAVCALASRNSPDTRVVLPGTQGDLSAGWAWFSQIRRPFSGPVVKTASLYELQLCCLCIMFRQAGSDLESCWLLSGIGILHAEDIGANRRVCLNGRRSIERELIKRSYYFLYMFDAISSACFGRSRVATMGESDIDRHVVCDDEYWGTQEDPAVGFGQTPEKLSTAAFYNSFVDLVNIFVRSSGSRRWKLLDSNPTAELDCILDQWAKEIPDHLRWNPKMEDDIFFDQSATLYVTYYHVQILIHRSFIRITKDQPASSLTVKSLAICTNAARSCSHLADAKLRRGFMPNGVFMKAILDSAIVLLLNISGGTRSGLSIDIDRELVDVYKCMSFLCRCERRLQNAGRFYDILCEFMNAVNLPLPTCDPSPDICIDPWFCHSARNHEDSGTGASLLDLGSQVNIQTLATPNAAAFDSGPASEPNDLLSLPLGAEHLGSLPIYDTLDPEVDLVQHFCYSDHNSARIADTRVLPYTNLLPSDFDASIPTGEPMDGVFDGELDLNTYLSHWIPYFTSMEQVAQNESQQPNRAFSDSEGP